MPMPSEFRGERKNSLVHGMGKGALALGMAIVIGLATPATASTKADTRLVKCHSDSCLLISGHRDNAAAAVHINGHPVSVEGRHNWQVRLPIETVRAWSEPFARTIEVAMLDSETSNKLTTQANLPIGLLCRITNLASLVISAQ